MPTRTSANGDSDRWRLYSFFLPSHDNTKPLQYDPDLEAILSMPLLDNADVGINGEKAHMEYYKEKYTL